MLRTSIIEKADTYLLDDEGIAVNLIELDIYSKYKGKPCHNFCQLDPEQARVLCELLDVRSVRALEGKPLRIDVQEGEVLCMKHIVDDLEVQIE